MGFPREIKEKALVGAARHCSVCHRSKGLKVEVHHIQLTSEGGADDFDNAIVLCFDCHADAGHYNPRHPRGTKFSPQELKRARDDWYRLVKEHNIQRPAQETKLHCRYYLCRDYEAITEIANDDLSNVPAEKPLMVRTEALCFLKQLIHKHPHTYRRDYIYGDAYEGVDNYIEMHPESEWIDKTTGGLSYFDTARIPSVDEIKERIAPYDEISDILLTEGVPVNEISTAVTFYDGCGGVECKEKYLIRPLSVLFLAARNIFESPLTLEELTGDLQLESPLYRVFTPEARDVKVYSFPKASIAPGETVLVTLSVLLEPISSLSFRAESAESAEILPGKTQIVSHARIDPVDSGQFHVIGPSINPRAIKGTYSEFSEEIHSLDLSNLYVINRSWATGSCPHLFFLRDKWEYSGELLSACVGVIGESSVLIPEGTNRVMIAELEEESTWIESVTIGDYEVSGCINLEKGDYFEISCGLSEQQENRILVVRGYYLPKQAATNMHKQITRRNRLICNGLHELNHPPAQQDAPADRSIAARYFVG